MVICVYTKRVDGVRIELTLGFRVKDTCTQCPVLIKLLYFLVSLFQAASGDHDSHPRRSDQFSRLSPAPPGSLAMRGKGGTRTRESFTSYYLSKIAAQTIRIFSKGPTNVSSKEVGRSLRRAEYSKPIPCGTHGFQGRPGAPPRFTLHCYFRRVVHHLCLA